MVLLLEQTLLAPEDANGQPNFTNITGYDTPADGDLVYNINWTPGKSLGWIYYNEKVWKEFGLTDTGVINIQIPTITADDYWYWNYWYRY